MRLNHFYNFMQILRHSFGLLVVFSMCVQTVVADEVDWQEISRDKKIVVSRKSVAGSNIFAFRGEGIVDAPISKVVSVVRDVERAGEWLDRVVEIRKIEQVNPVTRSEYYHVSVPWPFSNRDFVYETTITVDKEKRTAIFLSHSVEKYNVPVCDGCVRGNIFLSKLILTALPEQNRTNFIGEVHVDPKGAIPSWLVNLVQKDWPSNTYENISSQLKKPDISDDPLVKDLDKPTPRID